MKSLVDPSELSGHDVAPGPSVYLLFWATKQVVLNWVTFLFDIIYPISLKKSFVDKKFVIVVHSQVTLNNVEVCSENITTLKRNLEVN